MNELKPEDVMRALECCVAHTQKACNECPMQELCEACPFSPFMERAALALLREKDAEIERLQGAVEQYEEERKYHFEMSRTRIAEAITEFEMRLRKDIMLNGAFGFEYTSQRDEALESISKIAKELKEGAPNA